MNSSTDMLAAMRYVRAVAAELDDLPEEERADLVDDVEQHVAEVVAEGEGGALPARLGDPAVFAAELRAAAGLPARTRGDADVSRLVGRLVGSRPGQAASRAYGAVTGSPAYARLRAFLPELRPGWWVLRGYLVVLWLTAVSDSLSNFPLPTLGGSLIAGLALVGLAIWLSVAWGRRTPAGGLRVATAVFNVALVAAALVAMNDRAHYYRYASYYEGHASVLTGPRGEITNIYPYTADGEPLEDVLLYDQYGMPIDFVSNGHAHRLHVTTDGQVVDNIFPREYFGSSTMVVEGAEPRPTIVPPRLAPEPSRAASASPSPSPSPKPTPSPKPAAPLKPTPAPSPTR